jgi:hypothetical protein
MDLTELRILAAAGFLAIGIVLSVLAVVAVSVGGWMGRLWRARVVGASAAGRGSELGAGGARC